MSAAALSYRRISSKDQSDSPELQLEENTMLCKQMGLHMVGDFYDNGVSAKSFDRPDWKRLEAEIIKSNPRIQYLVVSAYDRFSRNLREALEMVEKLEKKFGITVISVSEPIAAHPEHPDFFTQRANLFLSAEAERRKINYRTGKGVWQATKSGRYINRPPWGYIRDKRGSTISIDPAKAPIIREAFRLFVAGHPRQAVMKYLKDNGYYRNGNDALTRLLTCPTYAGLVKVKSFMGQPSYLTKGTHEAIITEAIYYRAQDILKGKSGFTRTTLNADVPLRGILKCFCGRNLTAGNSKGKNTHVWYYVCKSHPHININAKRVHAQMEQVMSEISLPPHYLREIEFRITERLNEGATDQSKNIEEKKRLLGTIQANITKLERKFIEDDLDKATYQKWKSDYISQQAILEAEIAEQSTPINEDWVELSIHMSGLSNMLSLYQAASVEQKQALLGAVFNRELYWLDGAGRTPYLMQLFEPKAASLKEKGLLFYEQPLSKSALSAFSSGIGNSVEPIIELLKIVADINAA